MTFSIFVSSPSDVALEREITRKLLQRLGHEFGRRLSVEPYFWEYEPMDFSTGYQPQIPLSSEFDVVVCIFHSKLGTPLTIEGTAYPSGTAYELIKAKEGKAARQANNESAKPSILVFLNRTEVMVPAISTPDSERRTADVRALNEFLQVHTMQGDEIVGALNTYLTTNEFEEKLEAKLRSLISITLESRPHAESEEPHRDPEWKDGSPFQGLFAFEFEKAPVFFGRGSATGAIIRTFQTQVASGRPRCVMVVGASGSGKSSLARAGVLPMLVNPGVIEGIELWRRAIMKPSDVKGDVFSSLAASLLEQNALPELADDGSTVEELAKRLRSSPEAAIESFRGALRQAAVVEAKRQVQHLEQQALKFDAEGYHNDAANCRAAVQRGIRPPHARLVLLVDQFEEVYTTKIPTEQLKAFTRCLRSLSETSDSPVFVVVTLPSAFYATAVEEDENIRELASENGTYHLAPPTEDEFAQMIRLPAFAAGLRFESKNGVSLDERLLKDARAHPDCLPLLEFCLEELRERCSSQPQLTFAAYESLGEISGVLAKQAGETLAKLPPGPRAAIDVVLPALINRDPNQTQVAVRRASVWQEVAPNPDAEVLVNAFAKARLLVIDVDSQNHKSVSVVHEALLRNWDPAKQWIGLDDNQDFLRSRERLELSYRNWRDSKPEERRGYLLTSGVQLAEAQDLLKHHPHAFLEMSDYVRASAWKNKLRRYAIIGPTAVCLIVGSLLYYSYYMQQLNLANQLLAQADHDLFRKDFAGAEIAAAKALTLRDTRVTRATLMQARSGCLQLISSAKSDTPQSVGRSTISRDGVFRASVELSNANVPTGISIRSMRDGEQHWHIESTPAIGMPDCFAFSAVQNGIRYFACGRADHTIGIWILEQNKPATQFRDLSIPQGKPGHYEKRIPSLAFHPQKLQLASCSEDKKLHMWDFANKEPKLLFEKLDSHATAVHGIALSEDGNLLASGGGDYLVKVWDVNQCAQNYKQDLEKKNEESTVQPMYKLKGHRDSVFTVAFSPDGKRIASAGYEGIVRVWDLDRTLCPEYEIEGMRAGLPAPMPEHPKIGKMSAHKGTILDLDFSADSKLLMSGGKDQTARLWDVSGEDLLLTLSPTCGEISSVTLVGMGDTLHCGGDNGWSSWNANGRPQMAKLWNGGATVGALAFDPLGKYVAVGGNDGKIRMWDKQNRLVRTLDTILEDESINALAISPDGRWLAAAGEGKQIHIWDGNKNWAKVTAQDGVTSELKHDGAIWGLCFAADGSWLASSNTDDNIRVRRWDAKRNWKMIDESAPSQFAVYAMAVDPNGKWIACGDADANIRILDTMNLKDQVAPIATVTEGDRNLWGLAVCPDPLSVYSGSSNGHVSRWVPGEKTLSGSTSKEDATVNRVINSISYSQDLKMVAAGGDGNSVEIYDNNLKKLLSLTGHEGNIWYVAFDTKTHRLAYGGSDRLVRVWNLDEVDRILHTGSPQQLYRESQAATGLSVSGDKVIHSTH